jgi:hypothetical protein
MRFFFRTLYIETNIDLEPPRKTQRSKTKRKMIDEEAALVRKMWTVHAIARKRFHWLCCVEALYPKMEYCNRN